MSDRGDPTKQTEADELCGIISECAGLERRYLLPELLPVIRMYCGDVAITTADQWNNLDEAGRCERLAAMHEKFMDSFLLGRMEMWFVRLLLTEANVEPIEIRGQAELVVSPAHVAEIAKVAAQWCQLTIDSAIAT